MANGSSEELRRSFSIVTKTTYLVGINPFHPVRDVNVRFVISVLTLLIVYFLCIYTVRELYYEWRTAIEVLLPLMITLMGTCKLWLGFVRKHSYCLLFVNTEEIYAEFDANFENKPELEKNVSLLVTILKTMAFMYSGAVVLLISLIVLLVVVSNEKYLLLRIYVPYVDHTTLTGYAITTSVHLFLIVYGANGYLAADTAFTTTVFPLIGYANSFKKEVDSLNRLLENQITDKMQSYEQLLRIVKLHQMILELQLSAIDLFKTANLVQISFQAASILMFVFMSLVLHCYQSLIMLLVIFLEVSLYCFVGTIITVKNEQMTADIYNINWYLLPKSHQQLFTFMLHRAQNAKDLCVGDFAKLNVVTFVQIIKMVYTFFTMLITMMDV